MISFFNNIIVVENRLKKFKVGVSQSLLNHGALQYNAKEAVIQLVALIT